MTAIKYLIRNRGQKQKAHIWAGNDTVCRMWSTGGLKHEGYSLHDHARGRPICSMCSQLAESIGEPVPRSAA